MKNTPFIRLFIVVIFLLNSIGPIPVWAEDRVVLPKPGEMVALSADFSPTVLKGLELDAKNPFRFHFFVDRGDSKLDKNELKDQTAKLIKYFLTSLTIPDQDLWVNLSPYEKNRIVPQEFGQTIMGRDLLAEDYLLKQITASLIYPENKIGREFWSKVYREAQDKYGTTNIPINTFNKVWIIPDKAVIYEHNATAFVLENHLKVMLEEDYVSLQKHQAPKAHSLASEIIHELVLPQLEHEVNSGQNFAQLRQVFYSLILATWYKNKIRNSILNQVYSNQNKIKGINVAADEKEKIYQSYLRAFKKGVFNYIQPEPGLENTAPRRYFSGGVDCLNISKAMATVGLAQADKAELAALSQEPLIDALTDLEITTNQKKVTNKNSLITIAVIGDPNNLAFKSIIDDFKNDHNYDLRFFPNAEELLTRPNKPDYVIMRYQKGDDKIESNLLALNANLKDVKVMLIIKPNEFLSENIRSISRKYPNVKAIKPTVGLLSREIRRISKAVFKIKKDQQTPQKEVKQSVELVNLSQEIREQGNNQRYRNVVFSDPTILDFISNMIKSKPDRLAQYMAVYFDRRWMAIQTVPKREYDFSPWRKINPSLQWPADTFSVSRGLKLRLGLDFTATLSKPNGTYIKITLDNVPVHDSTTIYNNIVSAMLKCYQDQAMNSLISKNEYMIGRIRYLLKVINKIENDEVGHEILDMRYNLVNAILDLNESNKEMLLHHWKEAHQKLVEVFKVFEQLQIILRKHDLDENIHDEKLINLLKVLINSNAQNIHLIKASMLQVIEFLNPKQAQVLKDLEVIVKINEENYYLGLVYQFLQAQFDVPAQGYEFDDFNLNNQVPIEPFQLLLFDPKTESVADRLLTRIYAPDDLINNSPSSQETLKEFVNIRWDILRILKVIHGWGGIVPSKETQRIIDNLNPWAEVLPPVRANQLVDVYALKNTLEEVLKNRREVLNLRPVSNNPFEAKIIFVSNFLVNLRKEINLILDGRNSMLLSANNMDSLKQSLDALIDEAYRLRQTRVEASHVDLFMDQEGKIMLSDLQLSSIKYQRSLQQAIQIIKFSRYFNGQFNPVQASKAMLTKGGIDLNPAQLSLKINQQGGNFKFAFSAQAIDADLVIGASFTIRSMTPVRNLPQNLGLSVGFH